MPKIFFAGAGTAGHVEPALAVARWFRENRPEVESHFLGTAEGVETKLVLEADFPLHLISKLPFPRRLNAAALSWPLRFLSLLRETGKLIVSADLVIGFGGYVAAPAYLAARRASIPIIAHEANAKMGLANKVGLWCGATMLQALAVGRGEHIGIPLRQAIIDLIRLSPEERMEARRSALRSLNLDPLKSTILVFGGSLGSSKFNETIAIAQPEISRLGFQIIHAVGGGNDLPLPQPGYFPSPYLEDMASAYAACELVISRSGAVTVTETGALGIYTLYVPLPIGNGEQAENAKVVVEAGGGEIINNSAFTPEWLLSNLDRMVGSAQSYLASGARIDFPLDASAQIAASALKAMADE